MKSFISVYDPEKFKVDGAQHDAIIDWGQISGSQQQANLVNYLLNKWNPNTPALIHFLSERGGVAHACVSSLLDGVKENLRRYAGPESQREVIIKSGVWKHKPKVYAPKFKGLIIVGGFQQAFGDNMSDAEFQRTFGKSKTDPDMRAYVRPIPIYNRWEHFGCKKNKQTKDEALEKIIRDYCPGSVFSVGEGKMRLFGRQDDNPYSSSPKSHLPAEPRSYWTLYIYEMEPDGALKLEKRDLWNECQEFFGTSDLAEIRAKNTEPS